jgi:branched-chain amino acid transport system substrate-binding protein
MHAITLTRRALCGIVAGTALLLGVAPALAQQGPGVTDKEIRLGTWMPLTGPIAAYGVPHRVGMEAYLNMVNDQGGVKGRKFVLVVEDNNNLPQRTVAAARKLVSRDDVLAIASPFGTVQSAATFDYLFEEVKVPLLNPYGGAMDWYTPPKDNLFGALVLYENQARALGRWAAKDGHKNIVVVHSSVAAFENVAVNVAPGAKSAQPSTNVELYSTKLNTTDYGPIARELAKKNPDAIVFIMAAGETIAASKELRQQGYKGTLYSYGPAVANSTIELGGAAVDGLKSASFTLPVMSDAPAVKEYRDALAKYFPAEKPDYVSLISFALTKIDVEAIRRIDGPINRQSLLKSLNAMQTYDTGIIPPISYSPTRHLGATQLQRVVVQGGQWVSVGAPVESDKDW